VQAVLALEFVNWMKTKSVLGVSEPLKRSEKQGVTSTKGARLQ